MLFRSLSGVKIISITAGLTKDGKLKSQDEKDKAVASNKSASTSKNSNTIFIDDVDHQSIVNSPKLAKTIKDNF